MRYNSPNSPADQIRGFFLRGGIPVTLTLLAVSVLTFLGAFFSPHLLALYLDAYFRFNTAEALSRPWTFLTYPLIGGSFSIWLIVTWAFFWMSGGSLERAWGSARYAAFFFALTAIAAASVLVGSALVHQPLTLPADLFLPLTGLIVAFCMLNPEQTVVLYFFPIRAKWVALIVTGFTFFTYGQNFGPIIGAFSCGGILAAYLYVRFGRSWADVGPYGGGAQRPPRGPDLRMDRPTRSFRTMDGSPARRSPLDLAGRWKDWQERRRLEKLWKNSGFSQSETEWRDDEGRRRR